MIKISKRNEIRDKVIAVAIQTPNESTRCFVTCLRHFRTRSTGKKTFFSFSRATFSHISHLFSVMRSANAQNNNCLLRLLPLTPTKAQMQTLPTEFLVVTNKTRSESVGVVERSLCVRRWTGSTWARFRWLSWQQMVRFLKSYLTFVAVTSPS